MICINGNTKYKYSCVDGNDIFLCQYRGVYIYIKLHLQEFLMRGGGGFKTLYTFYRYMLVLVCLRS